MAKLPIIKLKTSKNGGIIESFLSDQNELF